MEEAARPIRILLVDDHELVLNTMAAVMRLEPDFDIVGKAMTIADALRLTAETGPDVVVIDYRLPDGDGVEGTRQLLDVAPNVHVVMLTGMEIDDGLPERLVDMLWRGIAAAARPV